MVFSSLEFVFYFLPIVLILYYVVPGKYKNYLLLGASLLFYSYGEPIYLIILVVSIGVNYSLAMAISKCSGRKIAKTLLVTVIIINLGILFTYKYLDVGIEVINGVFHSDMKPIGLSMPLGISFFTFQALSYVVDVYRGTVQVQKNPLNVALYISFFPQLIAGPIVRYSSIEEQIFHRRCSPELFADGARRFILGFAKKMILANNFAMIAEKTFSADAKSANALYLWLGAICFSLQIFYDFSGYSDMAIGLGKMFGFQFEENFNHPYFAGSITEFWRRWHISLSQWFRDYVYIPLGGSRVSRARQIFNLFVVWMCTGLWHGANYTFVVWGAGYFVLLVLEKNMIRPSERKNVFFRVVWRIITLLCVNFGWVIFNSDSLRSGKEYCLGMLGYYGNQLEINGDVIFVIKQSGLFILLGLFFSTPIVQWIKTIFEKTRFEMCLLLLNQ